MRKRRNPWFGIPVVNAELAASSPRAGPLGARRFPREWLALVYHERFFSARAIAVRLLLPRTLVRRTAAPATSAPGPASSVPDPLPSDGRVRRASLSPESEARVSAKPSLGSGPHLIAAMVTPFTADGEIDRSSMGRLIARLRQGGVHEYFVISSTGEAPLLDDKRRLAVIEAARAAAPDGRIYAGVSGLGHRDAIRLARDAARAGADVAVLMSPFFLALDQEQLVAFCTAVADASPLPLALYHHLRMPTALSVPAIAQLARHANIVALKDTNGSEHNRCAEILAATAGESFQFFQGVEKLALPTLEAGGHGCVVAQACLAPQLFRALFDAWQAGQLAQAHELQARLTALWGIFSRREVRQSFGHFLHTLKLPLHQRGVLASTASALPRATFEPEFERMITEFMHEHLASDSAVRHA